MGDGWTDSASAPKAVYGTICGTDIIATIQYNINYLHFDTFLRSTNDNQNDIHTNLRKSNISSTLCKVNLIRFLLYGSY